MAEFPSEEFGLIVKVADMLRKGTPIKDKLTVGNLVMQSVLSITKLIEQQQQQIEQQAAEIAKKDRMIELAIDKLFILPDRDECPDSVLCPVTLPNTPDIGVCRKCWREWLEKEAEGVE